MVRIYIRCVTCLSCIDMLFSILSDQNEGHLALLVWILQKNNNTFFPGNPPGPNYEFGIPGNGLLVTRLPSHSSLNCFQPNRSPLPCYLVNGKNHLIYFSYIYIPGVYTMKLGAGVFSSTAVVSYISATVTSIKFHFTGPILLSALVRGRCPRLCDNIQHVLKPPSQIPTPSLENKWYVSSFTLIIYAR